MGIDELDYYRLEAFENAAKIRILAEKKAVEMGVRGRFAGQIKTLREIQTMADRLACNIIATLKQEYRRKNEKAETRHTESA